MLIPVPGVLRPCLSRIRQIDHRPINAQDPPPLPPLYPTLRVVEGIELLHDELVQVLKQRRVYLLPRLAIRARCRHFREEPKGAEEAIERILQGVFMARHHQYNYPEKRYPALPTPVLLTDTVPRYGLFILQRRGQQGNNLRLFFCVFISRLSLVSGAFRCILPYCSH